MKLRCMALFLGLILVTITVEASEVSEEGFVVRCEANVAGLEENLAVNANLTITERPTGAGLVVSYELLNLPYRAEVKIDFGEKREENHWTMYFFDLDNSEEFGRAETTVAPVESEFLITSKTPDSSDKLTFACNIRRTL